jgi:hypothetical protein
MYIDVDISIQYRYVVSIIVYVRVSSSSLLTLPNVFPLQLLTDGQKKQHLSC